MEPSPRKILILDDNPIDRETCRRYLEKSLSHRYDFTEHNAIDGALELVCRSAPDCILLDYHLHDGNGIEFLHELAGAGGTLAFPVVMLTGTGSETIAVTVMKAGAQDYLVKDRLNPEVLQRAVEGAIYKAQTERLLDGQRIEMERLFREAQEANARKDQFLAALSHELRTPLTPVLAAVSNPLLHQQDAGALRDTFAMIRRNIELEARLIDDMLDLTRISSGKLEVTTRPVDLHPILRHALETCEEDVAEKGITLTLDLAAPTHHVQADPARLQQVFWNLAKNAVKFTPSGGAIAVATRNIADRIEISVSDTGIGIEDSLREKIFDAFEQGNSAITRKFGGVGLGLAISKALVEAHHGTIGVHPQDTGACLVVTLPVAASAPAASPESSPARPDRSESRPRPATILLVEDHADTALLLASILEIQGYRVRTAGTVREALSLFAEHPIDCVISDIGLPDGTGIDLMSSLTARRPIPAVALSGFGMDHDIDRSKAAGFSHHLTKPVDWPRLEEVLHQLLS